MRSYTDFEEFECITCAIKFWVPNGYINARRRDGATFYCPNGHNMVYHETEGDRIRKERDKLKQNEAYLHDRVRELTDARARETRRVNAAKGQITKLKKRASHGQCPCCNRSFLNLARHMGTKHPGFVAEPDATATVN